jgi:hypothetical protein
MQRWEIPASLAGFLLLPATVYVTPRRLRKPPPVLACSAALHLASLCSFRLYGVAPLLL